MSTQKISKPNYINNYSTKLVHFPDYFTLSDGPNRPDASFVIARSRSGEVASYYGEDTWDFRHYAHTGTSGKLRLGFSKLEGIQKEDAKWLLFLLIYVFEPQLSSVINLTTIKSYKNTICRIAYYARNKNMSIISILENKKYLIKYISQIKTKGHLTSLSVILNHFSSIPQEISGFDIQISDKDKSKYIKKHALRFSETEQVPVIPQRIFSELITQLIEFLNDVSECKDLILNFTNELIVNTSIARSNTAQWMRGYLQKDFEPNFVEASEMFGLSTLFYKYGVENIQSYRLFLTRIQHGCNVFISIYSGMRQCEILYLTINSLQQINTSTAVSYKLEGYTSKLAGQLKTASWVTSDDILIAYEVAKSLAAMAGGMIGLESSKTPLFISLSYLSFDNNVKYDGSNLSTFINRNKNSEIYALLDQSKFVINEYDIEHLERINPFRAWEAEKAFSIGSIWRFTSHQFRRSLAFYVAQSALVSLPSLKRQLKHLNSEMTMYYSRSMVAAEEYSGYDHISKQLKAIKPTADAAAYLYDVLMSDEKLFGAHGKFVEANAKLSADNVLFGEERKNLTKRFKNGEIAYAETPLGACTTIEPCNEKALRIISACIGCQRAVIKPSKLKRVIELQSVFVNELKSLNPNSIEYRTEMDELKTLKHFNDRVVDGHGK